LLFPAAVLLAAVFGAAAATTEGGASTAAALDALAGRDLVVFEQRRKGAPARVLAATRVGAAAAAVRAVLLDPNAWRQAVPALVRAEVVGPRRPAEARIAWEIEIPLFNLEGKLRVISPSAHRVDLELLEGDLAPGRLSFTLADDVDGATCVVAVEGHANLHGANWLFRRLLARSPLAEPAMTATAAWVLLRAATTRAVHPGTGTEPKRARRPRGPPAPPPARTLDARPLGHDALAPFRARGVVAAVESAAGGRLAAIHVAGETPLSATKLAAAVATPETWQAFPGWKRVSRASRLPAGRVTVEGDMLFTDFDATWRVEAAAGGGVPVRATAVAGRTRGAVLGWDVIATPGGRALALFSLNPLLETTGWLPRRFIEAEPLLEHGLSLALAYVDAVSVLTRITGARY